MASAGPLESKASNERRRHKRVHRHQPTAATHQQAGMMYRLRANVELPITKRIAVCIPAGRDAVETARS